MCRTLLSRCASQCALCHEIREEFSVSHIYDSGRSHFNAEIFRGAKGVANSRCRKGQSMEGSGGVWNVCM